MQIYMVGMKHFSLTEKMIDRMTFGEFTDLADSVLNPPKKVESMSSLMAMD